MPSNSCIKVRRILLGKDLSFVFSNSVTSPSDNIQASRRISVGVSTNNLLPFSRRTLLIIALFSLIDIVDGCGCNKCSFAKCCSSTISLSFKGIVLSAREWYRSSASLCIVLPRCKIVIRSFIEAIN